MVLGTATKNLGRAVIIQFIPVGTSSSGRSPFCYYGRLWFQHPIRIHNGHHGLSSRCPTRQNALTGLSTAAVATTAIAWPAGFLVRSGRPPMLLYPSKQKRIFVGPLAAASTAQHRVQLVICTWQLKELRRTPRSQGFVGAAAIISTGERVQATFNIPLPRH